MVFLSSQIKIEVLPDSKEEICNYDWFLFSSMIQGKNIRYDDELCLMRDRLIWYPFAHKETLYTYLMSDNYYFKSELYKVMKNTAAIICMKKINDLICLNNREIFIPEEERIFREENIMEMFDTFKRNNFRENPICEYILPDVS